MMLGLCYNSYMNDSFKDRVLQIVKNIKKGDVMTYKSVAAMAGSPRASRAVGSFMRMNYDKAIPCHRVVRSDGVVGDYNRGGINQKVEILKSEGVVIVGNKVIFK